MSSFPHHLSEPRLHPMHLYVELWNARPEWLALSIDERENYISKVGPGIKKLNEAGVELVGFALNDPDTPHRSDHRYLAVWKMPDGESQVNLLEETLEEAGWHEYFEQVNARGALVDPSVALRDMVQLEG